MCGGCNENVQCAIKENNSSQINWIYLPVALMTMLMMTYTYLHFSFDYKRKAQAGLRNTDYWNRAKNLILGCCEKKEDELIYDRTQLEPISESFYTQ